MSKKTNFGKINGREAMVVGIIIVMVALFSILSPTFRTYSTFVSVLDMSYYIALMAIGVTFTLITGGVDLSIGTGLICYSLFGGYLIVHKDVPVVVALIACLVLSILIGALNGFLVAIMDLPPFLHDNKRSWFFAQWRIWCFLAVFLRAGRMVQKDFQVYGKWKGNSNWYCSCCSACSSYEFYIKTYEDRTLYNCYRK